MGSGPLGRYTVLTPGVNIHGQPDQTVPADLPERGVGPEAHWTVTSTRSTAPLQV